MQLTVAPKLASGLVPLNGATGMTRPVTLTCSMPLLSSSPVPDVIAHGLPPATMPRSLTVFTSPAETVDIDVNCTSGCASCADATPVAPSTRPSAEIEPTTADLKTLIACTSDRRYRTRLRQSAI